MANDFSEELHMLLGTVQYYGDLLRISRQKQKLNLKISILSDSAVFHITLRTTKTPLNPPSTPKPKKITFKKKKKKMNKIMSILTGKFWVQFFNLKGSCLYKNHFHIFSRLGSWSCKCCGIACNDWAIKLVSCLLKTIMIYIYFSLLDFSALCATGAISKARSN